VPFREGWLDLQDARINTEVENPRLCATLIINSEIDERNTVKVVWNEKEYMSMCSSLPVTKLIKPKMFYMPDWDRPITLYNERSSIFVAAVFRRREGRNI
jgi:hypothetical protein